MKNDRDRCIAMAGIFQATELADRIACTGMADSDALESSVYSLFQVDPETVEAVYGGLSGVRVGLNHIHSQLAGSGQRSANATRYAIALIHLERKLAKRKDLLGKIASGLEQAQQGLDHFPMLHTNTLARLADIYSETISTMQPRIMVKGEPLHLQNQDNVNKIRCLLLAGIRSAMLWRQCGGSRFQVLLSRKKLLREVEQLRQIAANPSD